MSNDLRYRKAPIVQGRTSHAVSETNADVVTTRACRGRLAVAALLLLPLQILQGLRRLAADIFEGRRVLGRFPASGRHSQSGRPPPALKRWRRFRDRASTYRSGSWCAQRGGVGIWTALLRVTGRWSGGHGGPHANPTPTPHDF